MTLRLLHLPTPLVLLGLLCGVACGPPRPRIEELRALQAEGRYDETVAPLKQRLERNPDDLELNRLLGLALMASDSPSTAVWALRRVTEHPEHSANDLFLLAQAFARGGVHAQGLETAERVLEIEPDHLGALLLRMNVATHLKRWSEVLDSADRVLVLEPGRPLVHLARAEALLALERPDEASAALADGRAVLARRPPDPALEAAICQLEIEVVEERAHDDELEELWGGCLARSRGSNELADEAIEFFDARGEPARATSLLRRAVEEAPLALEIRSRLVDRLDADGRREEALKLLLEATELEGISQPAWLVLASFRRDRDDYAAAARATEQVLLAREFVPMRLMAEYGDDLVRAGELDKAEEVIEKIDRPEWAALLRGRLLLERGDAEGALAQLEEGIRLWPGNSTARLLAGRAAERLGDFDRALSEYRDSVRSDVESTSAVFELAGLYEAEGRYQSALFPLTLRLRRRPEDERAGLELVRVALAGRNLAVARGGVESLRSNGHEDAAAVAQAMITSATGGPSAAADELADLQLDFAGGAHADVFRALIGYLLEADRASDALSRSRRAVETDPEVAEFHTAHAEVLLALARAPDAAQAYERALDLDPDSPRAVSGLAGLRAEQGRHAEALALYDRAREADPADADAAWRAVRLAVEAESAADVDDRLEALLFAHPRHARAANLLARRLLEQGQDLDRAQELARRAVRFGGGAEALETGGRIALASGDTSRALRSLRLSLERRPNSATTRYHLARALIEAGEDAAARRALEKALATGAFPEEEAARDALAGLETESDDG
jgi:tetratricopeptide (TPR) repeat protein